MTEYHHYTVASDSETSVEDKQQYSLDIAIGIDIGTSQCRIAVWNHGQVELVKTMPSSVLLKDDSPESTIQNVAYNEEEILSGSAIFNLKRLIGRVDTDPVVHASKTLPFLVQTLDIGGRPLIATLENNVWRSRTPEELLASLFWKLKGILEVHFMCSIRNVVLTVPVSFNRIQLTRIERACAMAGLYILRLMPEPTAVALLYAQQLKKLSSHENFGNVGEKKALIFNMGAGYCDVAVISVDQGISQIITFSGSTLGGEDILQNVLHLLVPNFDSLFSSHSVDKIRSLGLLRIATQDAIDRLSSQTSVPIDVDIGDGTKILRDLDRSEFEEVNCSVFGKCEELVSQCLLDAKVDAEDIADVILVGGCSNIPRIKSLVLGLCKRNEVYQGIDPLEAAVYGAALEGAIASGVIDLNLDILAVQAAPLSLGIRADGNSFVPIINRKTAIPVSKEMFFTTTHDNQTEALIVVYEGEGKQVEENHVLGFFKVTGIPPVPKGSAEIIVGMDINVSNELRVLAGVCSPGTRQALSPFFEVKMPMSDGGHEWCTQALVKKHGSNMDLATAPWKLHP